MKFQVFDRHTTEKKNRRNVHRSFRVIFREIVTGTRICLSLCKSVAVANHVCVIGLTSFFITKIGFINDLRGGGGGGGGHR